MQREHDDGEILVATMETDRRNEKSRGDGYTLYTYVKEVRPVAQQINSGEAKISSGLAVREGDDVEDEEDNGEGVLGLGSVTERTWGGTAVLGFDGGEAGDAPTQARSSRSGRPWWL